MKKFIRMILLLCLMTIGVSSCAAKEPEVQENVTIHIAGLKGPTSMGMVKMIEDKKDVQTGVLYDFTMYTAADEIVSKIAKGEIDIAAIPANLASILYQKTEKGITVIDINTLGVLYVVENGTSIQSFSDLKGKTIYMTGKGTTPEYALNYLLGKNGLTRDDVAVEFKTEATEVASILQNTENAVGLLPQPFVTVACNQNEALRIALNLTEEWDKVQGEEKSSLVTGVTVVRNQFLEEHPEAVKTFLEEHKSSADFVNKNIEEAAALIESYDIVKAVIAEKAIPYCNITCITGKEMKEKLSEYLNSLLEQNPEAVGGQLPDEAFYYTK